MWIAIHAPGAGTVLVATAAPLAAWALIADGPFGIFHLTGLAVHRRGLIVLALLVGLAPLFAGRLSDPIVLVPCLLAAAVLLRCGLLRFPAGIEGPLPPATGTGDGGTAVPTTTGRAAPPAAVTAPAPSRKGPPVTSAVARVAGRAAGRAGKVASRQAETVVPRGARAAGRYLGRRRSAGPH